MIKSMVRVGIVSDRDPKRCAIRVIFPDQDNLVTDWLPVVVTQALKTRAFSLPDIDETVVCVFLGSGVEKGYCLGAIYDEDNVSASSGDQSGVWFPDGSRVVFDRSSGVLTVEAKGGVSIKAPTTTIDGNVHITGNLTVDGGITRGGVSI